MKILSFKNAFSGIFEAVKEEPNLKFHLASAWLTVILGLVLDLTKTEWMIVILLIGLVVSLELTNTAIEEVVDSFTDLEHPGAKLAKDVSAGAVLIVAFASALVGLMIFVPHLWTLFWH